MCRLLAAACAAATAAAIAVEGLGGLLEVTVDLRGGVLGVLLLATCGRGIISKSVRDQ